MVDADQVGRAEGGVMRALVFALIALLAAIAPTPAFAQPYPTRPVTLVVPFVPGGSASVMARAVADRLSETLGQPIVIDNRGGAGTTIGARAVAKSAPDGYTILLATNATLGVAPNLYANAGYDPRKDFAPLGLIGVVPTVVVVLPSSPFRTLADVIKRGKETAERIEYGTPGIGTVNHLAAELLGMMAGIKLTHVPYRGAGPALNDLLGGHIPLLFSAIPNVHGHIEAGTLRALAVTSPKRAEAIPEVATVAEAAIPGFDAATWFALVAPAGTPREIVTRLNAEVLRDLAQPDTRRRFADLGMTSDGSTPQALDGYIKSEIAKWSKVIKEAAIPPAD